MAKDITINYENKPCYNICLRQDFEDFAEIVKSIVNNRKYDKVCIVTDSNVAKLYLDDLSDKCKTLFDNVYSFVFDAGEAFKNLDTVSKLYEHLIINKFTRKSLLVALGGGVVGDLTGFTASTYLRGIDFIQVPTTLLSQVDSSVGGKTGVDFNQYKNMVGAFYMPKLVYMNLSTLKTLDDNNFICGMGEIVKSALIQDADFYKWLKENKDLINSKNSSMLEYMVEKCCRIKGYVVEVDPKEQGIRTYLNFGHTLGHAIEKMANFNLGHGQCVGLGMVCASYLSKKLGYLTDDEHNDIVNTIKAFNLPIIYSGMTAADVLSASKSDKKMVGAKINFTVLKKIGEADNYIDFSEDDLLEAINIVLE